jgi:hypothetical protein
MLYFQGHPTASLVDNRLSLHALNLEAPLCSDEPPGIGFPVDIDHHHFRAQIVIYVGVNYFVYAAGVPTLSESGCVIVDARRRCAE